MNRPRRVLLGWEQAIVRVQAVPLLGGVRGGLMNARRDPKASRHSSVNVATGPCAASERDRATNSV